ncbi:DsbE family thiol:disulfide interchange protein [Prosthecomicrobium sp. N25]|uniref:DsbE family thiol:disulfide interchange protein n=1 Tax=Prosthecomicrobium sp. N25 TaxID=3129254 RepID=UPI003076AED4
MTDPGLTEAPRRGRSLLLILPLVLFLALAGLFLYRLATGGGTSEVPSALIGRPVPAFELPPLEGLNRQGNPVPGLATADLKGRVTVVNVWASWCVPCRQEHPILEDLAKDGRIRVVGINYKDEPENALRFLGQLGNPFAAVGTDRKGRTAIDWGVYGVPETFVVAADGTIAYKFIGPLSPEGLEARLKPEIEKALARK